MTGLTSEQLATYELKGFVSPIDVFTIKEVNAIRAELEALETSHPEVVSGRNRNNAHYVTPLLDEIAHNSKILDAVESVIGSNILVGGTTLFVKEPEQNDFISWHQDARYIGLEPYNWVTAWLALSDVTKQNGCMYMWEGSHRGGVLEHVDTFDENNLLTRGQTILDVPDSITVPIELRPGQFSLHHPLVVHGSGQNLSSGRRIGFAIQSYIGDNVDSVLGQIYVQQARGRDTHGFHHHAPRPASFLEEKDVIFREKANIALKDIFYRGAKRVGKF